jgi:hypothetical protein
MDQSAYDDWLQRMKELLVKMDKTLGELKELNRQQVALHQSLQGLMTPQRIISQRLGTLLGRAWRSSTNGR